MTCLRGAGRRPVAAAVRLRLAWGAVLLLAPDRLLAVTGDRPDRASRITLRVLGIRHLLQAAAVWRWPVPAMLRVGVAVDALHGSTAAVLAAVEPRQRRVTAVDAVVACAWAGWGAATAGHGTAIPASSWAVPGRNAASGSTAWMNA